MLSIHPHSQRLNIIFSDSYASSGNYKKALEYLQHQNGLGTQLQRLCIQCGQEKKLDSKAFINSINSEVNPIIGTYEIDRIITLSNLGLDNICNFSKIEFIEFLSRITKLKSLRKTDAQKVFIYLAHYNHLLGFHNKAIKSLENSYSSDTTNPIPLFLMIEWLIEKNKIDEAKAIFKKATYISDNSFYDFSDFINRLTPMLD
jgi:tetratricopeptide (TPR) repeat protein